MTGDEDDAFSERSLCAEWINEWQSNERIVGYSLFFGIVIEYIVPWCTYT